MEKSSHILLVALHDLGLSDDEIDTLAVEVDRQLGALAAAATGAPVEHADAGTLLGKIDVPQVASRVGTTPQTARAALQLLAPVISGHS